jgi:hypothetical protein
MVQTGGPSTMRPLFFALLLAGSALLNSSTSQAQVPTAAQVRDFIYDNCVGQGHGPAFCGCWVSTALRLLRPEETFALLRIPGYEAWLARIPYVDQQANGACGQHLPRR